MGRRSLPQVSRLAALFAALAGLWFFARPTRQSLAAGAPLVVAGEILRLWAAGHLVKTRQLILSGPYRFTRNPFYLGRLLVLSGLGLVAWIPPGWNLLFLACGWLGFFGYYLPRKERIEPARLEAIHGAAYAAYRREVPALFPRLSPWGSDRTPWRWGPFWTNREGLTALFLALVLFSFFRRAGVL